MKDEQCWKLPFASEAAAVAHAVGGGIRAIIVRPYHCKRCGMARRLR